ncbi:MAG: rRNA maturation RNase YbeY [Spirochaetia bacterium]|nr:rRNA maturation RNase YbeY [Spirochaetia bacterium]
MNNTIDIQYNLEEYEKRLPYDIIESKVNLILDKLSQDEVELSITFVSDEEIQELNKQWRDKDMPTDILSFVQSDNIDDFDFWPDADQSNILGDMVISISAIERNCENFDVPFSQEVDRILIHGILHLLGHDHKSNDKSEPMLLLQEKILSSIREI